MTPRHSLDPEKRGLMMSPEILSLLQQGTVIPACPLALTAARRFDERRQRALVRYYLAAGAGGLAVGVHTTQFAIREPRIGLFEPVLELAVEELRKATDPVAKIGGICGPTKQALAEAELLVRLKYDAGLLSLGALREADDDALVEHCRAVAEIIPLFGFYLQPAVGGRLLSYAFWRRFLEIENVVAIKIAPFNRYQTLDVVRAVADSGRGDVALYTGNDDQIVLDLLTPFPGGVRIVGGLLGHWAVWTKRAVELLEECRQRSPHYPSADPTPSDLQMSSKPATRVDAQRSSIRIGPHSESADYLLRRAIEITDCNAAFFDAANQFAGCIAGLHEVLRRQGLLEGIWCLDEREALSPGQMDEIDRVYRQYPHLNDDAFVAEHRDAWFSG